MKESCEGPNVAYRPCYSCRSISVPFLPAVRSDLCLANPGRLLHNPTPFVPAMHVSVVTPPHACKHAQPLPIPILPSLRILQPPHRTPLPINLSQPTTRLRLQSKIRRLMERRALLEKPALPAETALWCRRRRREAEVLMLVRSLLVLVCFRADGAEGEVGDLVVRFLVSVCIAWVSVWVFEGDLRRRSQTQE